LKSQKINTKDTCGLDAIEACKKAQELLDTKYSLMAQQFAAYTAIITQMEAAFGGMKMMIQSLGVYFPILWPVEVLYSLKFCL
jgi:hypothetical protein